DIAVELRVVENPKSIPRWLNIQTQHVTSGRRQPSSPSVLDGVVEALNNMLSTRSRNVGYVDDRSDDDEPNIAWNDSNMGGSDTDQPVYIGRRYMLFEDYNNRGVAIRLFMHTIKTGANAIRRSLEHLFTSRGSYIAKYIGKSSVSITFATIENGVERFYTFSTRMGVDSMLREFAKMLQDDVDLVGSDTYRTIRKSLSHVYVNIVHPGRGGTKTIMAYNPTIVLAKQTRNVRNLCFYQCLRRITGLRSHYTTMSKQVMGDRPTMDYTVPLKRVRHAEISYNIHILVLYNQLPQVVMLDDDTTYSTYESIRRPYVVEWNCYTGTSYPHDRLRMYHDDDKEWGCDNMCKYVVVDDVRYYIIMFDDDHYQCVMDLVLPMFCVRCGADDHTSKDADKTQDIRYKCMSRLYDILGDNLQLPTKHLVFFDFETFVKDGILCPYMVSYQIHDEMRRKVDGGTIVGPGCYHKFFSKLLDSTPGVLYLISYNGASFDNYFIMKAMTKRNMDLSSGASIIYNNKILRLSSRGIITWDLCQFVKSSLSDACKNYKIGDDKHEMDHRRIQELFEKHNYTGNVFTDGEYEAMNVASYCAHDVELLSQLYYVVTDEIRNLTGLDPIMKPTLSSLCYAHMSREWKKTGLVVGKMPMSYNDIFSSIPGGRVQALDVGKHVGDFVQLDINGMYPHICLTNLFPNGKFHVTKDHDISSKRLYMVEVEYVDQTNLKYKLVATRDENGRLSWTDDVVHDVWLWKEEFETLQQHKCVVKPRRYLVWKHRVKPFDVMKTYTDERAKSKQSGNVVREQIVKLASNSITGKLVERNHDEVWTVTKDVQQIYNFVDKYKPDQTSFELSGSGKHIVMKAKTKPKDIVNRPRHWGCRVYALARLALWRYMMLCDHVYYVDTDSIITNRSELHKFSVTDQLGDMKIDKESDNMFVLSPKSYYIGDKFRMKGYRRGDKWTCYDTNTSEILDEGEHITERLFTYILDDRYDVTTHFEKISKRFVRKEDGRYYLSTLVSTAETHSLR
ncbi:hypothetical protein MVEG_12436, partial [Podila verticillata NRRL 6337]